jgi:riboflavin kinase / FMN adenylyltransferase
MKITYGIGRVDHNIPNAVVAIGVFDGVHRGHQALIHQTMAKARRIGGPAYVMTFFPHPATVLHPERRHVNIITLPHRLRLIESLGVDGCIVIPFTRRFADLTPEHFVKQYLVKHIQPAEIFVGFDFRFGHDREGTLAQFERLGRPYGFHIDVVGCIKSAHAKISSSKIRQKITHGDLDGTARLLGRRFSIQGVVERGFRRGRTLGYRTANLYPKDLVLPPLGVYATRVHVGKNVYGAMTNVGYCPMFSKDLHRLSIESHLFGFRDSLYDRDIEVEFIRWTREEKIFSSKEQFLAQLQKDENTTKTILASLI